MNRLIAFLAEFCRDHVLEEKLVVVPSYSIGHQIGEALTRAVGSWVNLRFTTPAALARDILSEDLSGPGVRQYTETELLIIVDRLFRELREGKRLDYFFRLEPSPGVVRSLYTAIQSIRLAGSASRDLKTADFRVEAKSRDLLLLLEKYEDALKRDNALDRPGLCLRALEKKRKAEPSSPDPGWLLSLRDRSLARVEKELVEAASEGRLVLIPSDPVFGLTRPDFFWEQNADIRDSAGPPVSDSERLRWLFAPHSAPPPLHDGTLSLFHAVGATNECREVLRRIVAGGGRFDDAEVIHPPGTAYPVLFHLLSERSQIKMTFADGLPVTFTSPGRVFMGLADWIEGGFLVRDLIRLIEAEDFAFPFEEGEFIPSPQSISRHFTRARIVRGRERYLERLRALGEEYRSELENVSDEEDDTGSVREAGVLRSIAELGELENVLESLFRVFAGIGERGSPEKVDFRSLCASFATAVETYSRIRSELDDNCLDALLAEVRKAAAVGPDEGEQIELPEALARLRTLATSLSAGASAPLPGHLHVSNFDSGGVSGRPAVFLVGLDEGGFSGPGRQDPILLDEERRRISPHLPTLSDRLRGELFAVAVLLSSLRGSVTLSYPAYNIMEERASFPSSLVLQAHRLIRGNAGLDYSDLDHDLGAAAGYLPEGPSGVIDEIDWWLGRLSSDGRFLNGIAAVRDSFPELRNGIDAAEARAGTKMTAYEGIVTLGSGRFDPLANHRIVLSASRLELLARCPYGYFLRHVLRVRPPETLGFDPSRWLDPMQRGLLLHEILCEFMKKLTRRKEEVDPERHASLIKATARSIILRWREEVPPPSEAIYEKELKDMTETLGVFLVAEGSRERKVTPFEFEKRFDSVEISLGRGSSFLLRGVIDRIDRTGPSSYRVVDYKTGGYGTYEGLVRFGHGKAVQHALYALAAEIILKREGTDPDPHVTESGYSFPTRRGEGREIMIGKFDRRLFKRLLADMMDLIAKGYFIAGSGAHCEFCDFVPVCGGSWENVKNKIEANPEIFGAVDKLKRYE